MESRATRGLKRTKVLAEAAKSINDLGISQTSLVDIASRVGVSRAALYYYFEDQQDLVFQCYRQTCEFMSSRLRDAREGGGDSLEVIDAFVDGMLEGEGTEFAALSEVAYLRHDQRTTILQLYGTILNDIATTLQLGAARGDLRPSDGRVVAQAIIGLVSWIPLARRWRTREALVDADMVAAIKELLRFGVASDRAARHGTYRPFDLAPSQVPVTQIFDPETMAAARRESLLAAASWIFNLKGIDATSLDEIALLRGVTKKVIYHNVGDKETLVAECYRRAFDFYERIQSLTQAYEGTRIEAICAQFHALAEASLREDLAPLAPLAGFDSLPASLREEIQASAARIMERSLAAYELGRIEGSVRAMKSPRAMLSMHPGVFEWLPKWFDDFDADLRARAPRELAELIRIGLSPL